MEFAKSLNNIKNDVFAKNALGLLQKKKDRRKAALDIRSYSNTNYSDLREFEKLEKNRE